MHLALCKANLKFSYNKFKKKLLGVCKNSLLTNQRLHPSELAEIKHGFP